VTCTAKTIAAAAFVAAALCASNARANGRFPRAIRLFESPSDSQKLALVATYGLLLTEDRGGHWYHVCDAAITFEPAFASDPLFALTADESFLLGAQTRLTRSSDRGCDWTKVLEPPMSSIDDFTMVPSHANDVLAAVTEYGATSTVVQLQESADGGLTWKRIGAPLPAPFVYTLDVDPKDPAHVYATVPSGSADETAPALLLRSRDRGATWAVKAIPMTNANATPWIAAVHPVDGNRIFVRTDGWKNRDVMDAADDALLYSADGGDTWVELLHAGTGEPAGAKLLGFALSPDGSTVLAGYGDPMDPGRLVDPDRKWSGIYKSSADGRYSFGGAPLVKGSVSCLAWTAHGAYACYSPAGEIASIAFTSDASFSPPSTTTIMKTSDVRGAPPCCSAGRAVSACRWEVDCQALGACDAGAPPSPPPTCGGSDAGGGAGGGGSSGDAGPSTGSGGKADSTPAGGSTGCGCRLAESATSGSRAWCLVATAFAAAFGRALRSRSRRRRDRFSLVR
jgi:photosystem II stability/assembly factor-like uncharacterized protein